MTIQGVIFDLGGVVLDSPLHAIADFELERGIPVGFLNRVVRETGADGPWARLERGELDLDDFCEQLDAACEERGHVLPAADLMSTIAAGSRPRPEMLEALRRLRSAGFRTAALTNNWRHDGRDRHQLRPLFDVFVESCRVGARKPEPAIYEHTFGQMGLEPEETAFLDDIGGNLKPARARGVTTIKVEVAVVALRELGRAVGLDLLE